MRDCGTWANIRSVTDVRWVPLRDAVEFYIGPLELTITHDALEAFIAAATQAYRSMQHRATVSMSGDPAQPRTAPSE